MPDLRYIDEDVLNVYELGKPHIDESPLTTLFWGDKVNVVEKVGNEWKLDFSRRFWNKTTGKYEWKKYDAVIPFKTKFRSNPLLKIRFIDVGQGDAAIIESPQDKIVFIDGGEGDELYNYVSSAWAHIFRSKPLDTEAIIVSHGDADHFVGLTKLLKRKRNKTQSLINVKRVFHSGVFRKSSSGKETDQLGLTKVIDNKSYIVDLVDDPRNIPDSRLNNPSKGWKKALIGLTQDPADLMVKRIAYGSDDAFDFLTDEGIRIQVLGPITEEFDGEPALPFLHEGKSYSSSETINGHSVVLRVTYGNIHVLFGADLNAESETGLLVKIEKEDVRITSEILKVPHHGSADFNPEMLKKVSPTVSVISSGDEQALREYIHPRAGLVGALGKYSNPNVEKPLIYVTEMVAFFERIGKARVQRIDSKGKDDGVAFEETGIYHKKKYGIVHVRTDGKRVFVATHGGVPNKKESYAFNVDEHGAITFEKSKDTD